MRAEVWSPLQNAGMWLAAWLYGHESTDALIQALTELKGQPGSTEDGETFADFLKLLRTEVAPLPSGRNAEPILRLLLSGPGDPPSLPAGSQSSQAVLSAPEGGLLVKTAKPDRYLVLVPRTLSITPEYSWGFEVIEQCGPLPAPHWLSPGEADLLLSQSTTEAAQIIESLGYVINPVRSPRLTVGTLTDFYETPGLPEGTAPRAAKLFSRADSVAAIVEMVTDRLGEHSLDPQLLSLWKHIRQARMAGFAYGVSEWAK